MHKRRWTQRPPMRKQSSHPSADGVTSAMVSRWEHVSAIRSPRYLESGAVPVAEIGRRLVAGMKKRQKRRVRIVGRAHGGVRQQELAGGVVVEGGRRPHGRAAEPVGLR